MFRPECIIFYVQYSTMYYLLSTLQYNVLSFIYSAVQCDVTLHICVCAGQYMSGQDGINQIKEVAWVN